MRGARGAGHFVFPLPGFDFGTSWHIIIVGDFQCLLSGGYTIKVNLVKVGQTLTNFDRDAVYTIKVVQSF